MRLLVWFFLLALALPARASLVEVLPLPEMAARSDVVIRAVVVDKRVEQEGSKLVTWTTLLVGDAVKGAKRGELVVVYQPGALPEDAVDVVGTPLVRWTPGQPRYRVGDEVVFFGVRHARKGIDAFIHLSLGVGTFTVMPDEIRELVDGVVDVRTGQAPEPRRFVSWPSLRAALGGAR